MANTKTEFWRIVKLDYSKILTIILLVAVGCCLFSYKDHPKMINNVSETVLLEKSHEYDSSAFHFQDGDILFQDLDCGELCDAIEKVTNGINDKKFSHIGLVYYRNDSAFIIEAIGNNVHLTLLNGFVNRSKNEQGNPKIVLGRLKKKFRKLNTNALKFAVSQIATPYDNEFLYDNQKYYCSELIYDAYKFANNNQPFFQLEPMTFKDPTTGKTFPAWEKYYHDLNIPIPEGKLGCNPGGISCSNKIQIVKSFY